jgi:hypothetical protein
MLPGRLESSKSLKRESSAGFRPAVQKDNRWGVKTIVWLLKVEQLRLAPFWATARAATTSTKTLNDAPRVLNGSGGLKHSASQRQPSAWYAEPFGPHVARIFHTLERRVRARGLQQGCALVGRVPSRGAGLAFPSECELSRVVAAEVKDRPFDVPWLVLESSHAAQVWRWEPQTPLESIWTEIAEHAERHPDWPDATAD